MDQESLHFVQRRELEELLFYLDDRDSPGALLLGPPGTGKTTLLRMAEERLKKQERAVFFVNFRALGGDPGEIGTLILDSISRSPFNEVGDIRRILRTSAGAAPIRETAEILRNVGRRLPFPVLLFDALDESVNPPRMAAAVEQLSRALEGWKIVLSSRSTIEIRRFARFRVFQLQGFTNEEAATLLRGYVPGLSDEAIFRIADAYKGDPLVLR